MVSSDETANNRTGIGKKRYLLVAISAAVLVAGSATLTYWAVAEQWAPDVTGVFYDEAEHHRGVKHAEADAYDDGLETGKSLGFGKGEAAGYQTGYDAGLGDGLSSGYDRGYSQGSSEGWDIGYSEGWSEGYSDGWYDGCVSLFNGLGTDRVGDWWDFYYSSSYASYYNTNACL